MTTRRTIGFSLALLTASVLTIGLSGCGGGGASSGPQEEVKQIPAVNAKGEVTYSLEDESKAPAPAAK